MTTEIPPRLRAPVRIVAVGAVLAAVAVATHGWGRPLYLVLVPFVLLLALGYYAWGGRDGDMAAAVRRDMDERQGNHRLKVQALVGRVMSLAAAVSYLLAIALKVTLWPFAVALALPALTALAGWALYRDRDHGDSDPQDT